MKFPKEYKVLIFFAIALILLHVYTSIILPFLFALIVSMAFIKPCNWLADRGVNRVLGAVILLSIPLIISVGLGYSYYSGFNELFSQLEEPAKITEEVVDDISNEVEKTLNTEPNALKDLAYSVLENGKSIMTETFSTLTTLLSNLILIPIYILFILISRNHVVRFLHSYFSQEEKQKINSFLKSSQNSMINYLPKLLKYSAIMSRGRLLEIAK